MPPPTSLVVPALKKHTATVIMVHGLGDSGAGWISLAQNWRRRNKFQEVKFIFPNAPSIPITVNYGTEMPGWYDILNFGDLLSKEDEPGIAKSREYLHGLIKTEIDAGIASDRIVLGGFSQGGAMAIFSGITAPSKLGGIFGLSCYLLLYSKIKEYIPAENPNMDVPIFMGHGDSDPLVLPQWGQLSSIYLKTMGYKVDYRLYKGLVHSADPEEIDDLEEYLNERIPPAGDQPSQ